MELIDYTSAWVKGEVFQGKIMLTIGILLLICGIYIFKGDNDLLRGTLIPLGLILTLLLGYGGFQTFGRPGHIKKVTSMLSENPSTALAQEHEKATKDDKTYSLLKVVWIVLIIISAGFYLLVSQDYFKGLAIGFLALFLTTLIVDSVLHYRLSIYLEGLVDLM